MTRRDFLKNLCGMGVAAIVPVGAIKWLQPKPKPKPLSREEMIALAQAMVEPIKISLAHEAMRRRLTI